MSRTNSMIGIAVFIIGVIIYSSTFVIREDEQALVLQFGDPRREVAAGGGGEGGAGGRGGGEARPGRRAAAGA